VHRRREQHETSVTRVRSLLHDARKSVRRLARAVAGEPADVRHLLELAYGKRGRMMHVLARARQLVRPYRGGRRMRLRSPDALARCVAGAAGPRPAPGGA
jgi:hypothetical protein